jgi:hypothetical protein
VLRAYSSRTNRKSAQTAETISAGLTVAGVATDPVEGLLDVLQSLDRA